MKLLIPLLLETPRLQLRQFAESDWDALAEIYANPDCVKHTLKVPQAKWQTWRILAAFIGHWQLRGFGPYAVVEKASGQMVGPVGLWHPGEWPEPEIKWALRYQFWGKGYASEAAAAVRDVVYRDLKWKRVVSLILPENENSKKVAARVGAVYEKTIPFRDGQAEVFVHSPG